MSRTNADKKPKLSGTRKNRRRSPEGHVKQLKRKARYDEKRQREGKAAQPSLEELNAIDAPPMPASGSNLAAPRKRKRLVSDTGDDILSFAEEAAGAAQGRVDTKLERVQKQVAALPPRPETGKPRKGQRAVSKQMQLAKEEVKEQKRQRRKERKGKKQEPPPEAAANVQKKRKRVSFA